MRSTSGGGGAPAGPGPGAAAACGDSATRTACDAYSGATTLDTTNEMAPPAAMVATMCRWIHCHTSAQRERRYATATVRTEVRFSDTATSLALSSAPSRNSDWERSLEGLLDSSAAFTVAAAAAPRRRRGDGLVHVELQALRAGLGEHHPAGLESGPRPVQERQDRSPTVG